MPTLQELLNDDLGISMGSEKVASEGASVTSDPEISNLAESMGLFGGVEDEQQEKTAGVNEMNSLYNDLFPEDLEMTKEASELEKEAAEEALGARSFEVFADRFERRIEKMASELSGNATVSAGVANGAEKNPHGDPKAPQALPDNDPASTGEKIPSTNTVVTDEITGKQETKTVGEIEQQKTAMDYAVRKMLLMSQLED